MSVSVRKSPDNPITEVGTGKILEAGLEGSNPYLGLKLADEEIETASLKPWKFQQLVHGSTGILNWYLHDRISRALSGNARNRER